MPNYPNFPKLENWWHMGANVYELKSNRLDMHANFYEIEKAGLKVIGFVSFNGGCSNHFMVAVEFVPQGEAFKSGITLT